MDVVSRLENLARLELQAAGVDGQPRLLHSVDMRYKGQIHEVSVPIDPREADVIVRDFHRQYERRYGAGTTNPAAPVEALSWEVRASSTSLRPSIARLPVSSGPLTEKTRRPVYFSGGWRDTPIFERAALQLGGRVEGPAIIEAQDTTVLVNPGHTVDADQFGNLVIDVR
jgi:N-methylhydantoinase A